MTKKYDLCYDVLTIIACVMVVFFHCNGVIYNYSDTLSWKISVVERCVVYSAIPIFFMLTGAKLLDYRKRYSTKEYAKKRLLRVGVPFLFWNIFYVVYDVVLSSEMPFHSVKEFINQFINSEFQPRYWFFWPLFAIYLVIPVVSLLLEAKDHRKYLWYLVGITFALRWVLLPLLAIAGIQYNSYMIIPACGGYLMYVLFGYLISTQEWSREKRVALYIAAVCSGIFAVWYTITTSALAGKTQQYMLSYDFFPSGLTGAAIFVFVKHLFSNSKRLSAPSPTSKLTKIVRKVSSACMGVWLTHSLGILVVQYVTKLESSSYILRFACPPLIFLMCVAGVLVVKKIPLLKHIV